MFYEGGVVGKKMGGGKKELGVTGKTEKKKGSEKKKGDILITGRGYGSDEMN